MKVRHLKLVSRTFTLRDIEFEMEEQFSIDASSPEFGKRALRGSTFDLKAMLIEGCRDKQSAFQTNIIEQTKH